MTFKEKYSELYSNYEKAGKELETATKELTKTDGFGDVGDISSYFENHRKLSYHERQFHQLLNYLKEGNVKPETEFVEKAFMYEIMKNDQIKKGNWEDYKENQFFVCEVGLTNDSEVINDYQGSIYKFPVLNLNHGKECYAYLCDRLGSAPSEPPISTFNFPTVDESKPIFVKVYMRSK